MGSHGQQLVAITRLLHRGGSYRDTLHVGFRPPPQKAKKQKKELRRLECRKPAALPNTQEWPQQHVVGRGSNDSRSWFSGTTRAGSEFQAVRWHGKWQTAPSPPPQTQKPNCPKTQPNLQGYLPHLFFSLLSPTTHPQPRPFQWNVVTLSYIFCFLEYWQLWLLSNRWDKIPREKETKGKILNSTLSIPNFFLYQHITSNLNYKLYTYMHYPNYKYIQIQIQAQCDRWFTPKKVPLSCVSCLSILLHHLPGSTWSLSKDNLMDGFVFARGRINPNSFSHHVSHVYHQNLIPICCSQGLRLGRVQLGWRSLGCYLTTWPLLNAFPSF